MKKLILIAALIFNSNAALAADEFKIIIKDHKFEPANLEIPANKKVKLIVENQDKTAEEFESYDFHREKIIKGGSSATIFVGPLEPGVYKYFGEFNPKTAQGTLTAK
jgi:plastocyanin